MSFTNFLEQKILSHVFGGVPYTAPTTLYVALLTGAPTESGGYTEVTGNGYARVAVPASSMVVSGNNPTQVSNGSVIDFPVATGSWGTVSYAAIFDAPTNGNMLDAGGLEAAKTITNGDAFRFTANQLKITLE